MFLHEDDEEWQQPPGHIDAYSRYLVGPDRGSAQFDFRTSSYPPGGYVEEHAHDDAEQIYYVMSGAGEARCGDERRTVGPGSVIFVPIGAVHGLLNTGEDDLRFVIVTSPPTIPH